METEKEALTFEQASAELEDIVRKLEQGTLDLDATVALYQRGRHLVAHCQGLLDEVALRVQKLVPDDVGQMQPVPFDRNSPPG